MSMQQGKRIGLTGGIAAGKSTVSAYLRERGIFVLDADAASRAVVEPGQPGLQLLTRRYGARILQADGSLDRKALGGIIFSSDQERVAVNALLHPLIREWMQGREAAYWAEAPGALVVWDVPLLVETGLHREMDEIWLVTARDALRVQRIMQRDGIAEAEAVARINSQMPQAQKLPIADVVLENNTTVEELRGRVQDVLEGDA